MNWTEIFKNYVESYTYLDKLDNSSIIKIIHKTVKESVSCEKPIKDYNLFDIKLKTNWINYNNFSINYNSYDKANDENYTLSIMDTNLEYKNIKWIFENYFEKHFDIPFNKLFISENYKINRIKFDKIKYFIEYPNQNNVEYIKFNPNFNDKMEIKKLLSKSNIKLLFKPATCKSNTMLTFKLDGIIINYNPQVLFKYDFIKKIFDVIKKRNKENFTDYIEKIKEDRIIIDSRFNSYKFSKNKLKESNDKILDILN